MNYKSCVTVKHEAADDLCQIILKYGFVNDTTGCIRNRGMSDVDMFL